MREEEEDAAAAALFPQIDPAPCLLVLAANVRSGGAHDFRAPPASHGLDRGVFSGRALEPRANANDRVALKEEEQKKSASASARRSQRQRRPRRRRLLHSGAGGEPASSGAAHDRRPEPPVPSGPASKETQEAIRQGRLS
jgi:hypothetical protein